jgi:voltage-gated potassium channel
VTTGSTGSERAARRYQLGGIVFTGIMVALVAFGLAQVVDLFFYVILGALFVGVTVMYLSFPGSGFFCIALANFLAVYTCLFVFFVEVNFRSGDRIEIIIAYLLPIAAFNVGTWLRHGEIRRIVVNARLREVRHLIRPFGWLVPVFAIGALTFVLPGLQLSRSAIDLILIATMALIAGIVLLVARDVAIFLIDVGLMFEEFFRRVSNLILPATGFLTFYSMNIIVFACIYRIMDRYTVAHHFMVDGLARDIDFPESLYFSVITLSTVGYGDIVPISDVARLVAAVQIVFGIMLLLFGFYEIMSYAREREHSATDHATTPEPESKGQKRASPTRK